MGLILSHANSLHHLRQYLMEYPELMAEFQAFMRPVGHNNTEKFIPNSLRSDVFEQISLILNRQFGVLLNGKVEFRGDSNSPKKPKRVFAEAFTRIAYGSNDSLFEVFLPLKKVYELSRVGFF